MACFAYSKNEGFSLKRAETGASSQESFPAHASLGRRFSRMGALSRSQSASQSDEKADVSHHKRETGEERNRRFVSGNASPREYVRAEKGSETCGE